MLKLCTHPAYWISLVCLTFFVADPSFDLDWMFLLTKMAVLTVGVGLPLIVFALERNKIRVCMPLPVTWGIAAYLAWNMVTSTFISTAPGISLFGLDKWRVGFFSILLFGLLALCSTVQIKQRESTSGTSWLWILFGLSVLVALLSVIEMLGFLPITGSRWFTYMGFPIQYPPEAGAPRLTTGNSGWIAGVWTLLIPLPYILLRKSPVLTAIWILTLAIGIGSAHSKAVLGLFTAFYVIVVVWLILKKEQKRAMLLVPGLLVAPFVLPALQNGNVALFASGMVHREMGAYTVSAEAASQSGADRLQIYKGTLNLIRQRPLQGWGAETLHLNFFEALSPKEYRRIMETFLGVTDDEDVRRVEGKDIITKKGEPETILREGNARMVKPHNIVLEELYNNGLIGLALLSVTLVFAVRHVIRHGDSVGWVLLAALTLYAAYLMLWFLTVAVTPLAAVMFGLMLQHRKKTIPAGSQTLPQ